MARRFMKIRRVVIPFLTLAIMLSPFPRRSSPFDFLK